MNGKQRIEAVLRGEWPDKRPVMLHNFLMAIEEAGYTHKQYRENPDIAAKVHIMSAEKYDPDGILIDFDTATLAGAVGVEVDFPEFYPARTHKPLLNSLDEVKDLEKVDLSKDERVQIWLETTALVKKHFGEEKYIRGNCDQAPFSLASMIRSPSQWMLDLLMWNLLVFKLLDFCTDVCCQFISLMAETGADMVSNGDSPAGPDMISPEHYEKFALPYESKIVRTAHDLGLPHMLHICGNTDLIVDKMVCTGTNSIELDYKTNIQLVHDSCKKSKIVFSGNIDPTGVIAFGTPKIIEEKVVEILKIFKDNPMFIMNAGCAIPAKTPTENIKELIAVARNY
ncbi:uroporphyrinogen decarboxylase family protein [Bacteroidota bacterium]